MEMGFIFIRMLGVVGYEDFWGEAPSLGWAGIDRYWKIRATVLEREGEVYEAEFLVGQGALIERYPLIMGVGLEVTTLVDRRVPFVECGGLVGGREAFDEQHGLFWSFDYVAHDVLDAGRVYPVGIRIEFDCLPPDSLGCRLAADLDTWNRQLFQAVCIPWCGVTGGGGP